MGKRFADRIQNYVKASTTLQKVVIPYSETEEGKRIVNGFIDYNTHAFPQFVDEIRGISDGSGVPLSTIWLLNIQADLTAILNRDQIGHPNDPESCTDVMVSTSTDYLMGHNEDADAVVKQYAYLVTANFKGEPVSYTAYNYPGALAGNAFGFNSAGMVFSINALFPKKVQTTGIARQFIARAIYQAKSLDEVFHLLTSTKDRCTGFSLNVGSIHQSTIVNIEVGPGDLMGHHVVRGNYSHQNLYRYLPLSQHTSNSSEARLARIDQMPSVRSAQQIRDVLGDTFNKDYPIYRDGHPPDSVVTAATGVFYLSGADKKMEVYIDNPKLNPKPLYVRQMV
eukprot:TRINITY_DN8523_c0_g1_i2.p1 TRINITY_DN8523_c0_g1~~TRINITY_DN8523_c0_g1_i2.p1  ORF type:complete len:338 (-),score=64.81 TRINITY_DN8523_c0_g1_i2:75-1088(-)